MYLENGEKNKCTGCSACTKICPVGAITMQEDEEGFCYPVINTEKCIKCNLCKKKCAFIPKKEYEIKKAYGVKIKNENEKLTSQSGGAFVALSDYILDQQGVVYGADINEEFTVFHNRAENKRERASLKGSKYVQSEMRDSINKIEQDLKNGRTVMFSGTPCQVEGVKKALENTDTTNLYTCDLLCHGVPSPKILKDYIRYIELIENKKVIKFNFRDKKYGWDSHFETFTFEDGTVLTTHNFRELFYRHNILRPSCYGCQFSTKNRNADITIGDFWGSETFAPQFRDKKGTSIIFINTRKRHGMV